MLLITDMPFYHRYTSLSPPLSPVKLDLSTLNVLFINFIN